MVMAFASIFVPDFLVQAVVRADPALRGRAVALLEGAPPLTKVVAANEAALHAGIFPGMMKSNAEHFSGVALRPRSPQQEAIAHTALLDVCWSVSPRIEDTASDTVTLSLAGLESLFGSQEAVAGRLVQRAAECGLAIRVAVAANIEVALVAVRGYTGITIVPPGAENKILQGLPVQALCPPPELLEILQRWGRCRCSIYPSVWGRPACGYMPVRAEHLPVNWLSPSRRIILKNSGSWMKLSRILTRFLSVWDVCWTRCAPGLPRAP